ncbi:MAG: ADP-ribose diphosphatase [Pseudomonadota bacterium]
MTSQQSSYGPQDVTVLERRQVFQGFFRIEKLRLRHRLFAGEWSPEFERELFQRGHAAGVLLYDPALDQVVLIEQFRVGALSQTLDAGASPWLLELVAGVIDEGENAEGVARREAQEEAGCLVGELVHICRYFSSPGGSTEQIDLFCGRVDASHAGGIHGLAEEHEDIRVHVLSSDQAWQALLEGRLNNAMTIIAMQWLVIHKQALLERWKSRELV